MSFTRENARGHGRNGGTSTASRHGRKHMSAIGERGGRALVERHGQLHMQVIGTAGFLALAERLGGEEAARSYLREIGRRGGRKGDAND